MSFQVYIPPSLTFQDYIAIVQTARTWADGYDKKDRARLLATLAPKVTIDYTLVVAAWGTKVYSACEFADLWLSEDHLGLEPLATQHLLGQPYFKSVTENEIIVEWQQLASHGRRADEDLRNGVRDTRNNITETSNGRSWAEHRFVQVEGKWKIERITPSLLYQTGNFMRIRRPKDDTISMWYRIGSVFILKRYQFLLREWFRLN